MKVQHVGEFRVLTIRECEPDLFGRVLDTPEATAAYWREVIAKSPAFDPDVEQFHVIPLSVRRRPLGYLTVAKGTLDSVCVTPREVFRGAIVANAAAILILHNHPSGDPAPSEADIKITRDLIRGGQLLNVEVLDHIVMGRESPVSPKGFVSLRELGYFYS